jgi:MYXO-CTERM domain-containing protein
MPLVPPITWALAALILAALAVRRAGDRYGT